LSVLASVRLGIFALAMRDIDVDEVSQEEHKVRLESGNPLSEVLHSRKLERVLEWCIRHARLDAARSDKGVLVLLGPRYLPGPRRSGEGARLVPTRRLNHVFVRCVWAKVVEVQHRGKVGLVGQPVARLA
jgi:hypothetical protein